jgi:hypothetical protein
VFRWQVRINEREWKRELGSQHQVQRSANYYSQVKNQLRGIQTKHTKKAFSRVSKTVAWPEKRKRSNKNVEIPENRITSEARKDLHTCSIN